MIQELFILRKLIIHSTDNKSSKNSLIVVYYMYLTITYYWIGLLILDHLYLVGNLTNSKIAETKAKERLKS
jgi:hypothetical protein